MLVNITKKIVIVFIIGILVGAIIATAGFLIFSKCQSSKNAGMTPPGFSQSGNQGLPGISNGDNSGNFQNGGQPPQMPGDNNSGNQANGDSTNKDSNGNQQPPQMPGDSNSNSTSQLPGTSSF